MRLSELIEGIEGAAIDGGDVEVRDLQFDSRRVGPGCLFAALRGVVYDGNAFIGAAIESGATAILSEAAPAGDVPVAWVRVPDARKALATVAKRFYGSPDDDMTLVGVTGTNGKTSVAHLLHAVLNRLQAPAGMLGTISHHIGRELTPAPLTTPEAPDVFGMLRAMREGGCRSAVMEASSHAIDRHRVTGLAFDAVVFTNLTRDHLDYHGDMESYFEVKRRLFFRREDYAPTAVVGSDDEWGTRLLRETDLRTISFGFKAPADVLGSELKLSIDGTSLVANAFGKEYKLGSRLIGRPNAENLLAAFAATLALGLDGNEAAAALAEAPVVRGRLERVPTGRPFEVLIDYAHTDDALRRLLLTANELTSGRVIALFGCGGDRDRGKRPLMGRHAVTLADVAVLTSDNPRSEDPMDIIREVEQGIRLVKKPRAEYKMIPDRADAIEYALRLARAGDLVLIAGKGHEDYQIIGGKRSHFDDREVVLETIERI